MAIIRIPNIIRIAAAQTIGGSDQPSIPQMTPRIIQQKNGPLKENAPLHAIPRAAPHMLFPFYHRLYANRAKNPLITKKIMAGPLVNA